MLKIWKTAVQKLTKTPSVSNSYFTYADPNYFFAVFSRFNFNNKLQPNTHQSRSKRKDQPHRANM